MPISQPTLSVAIRRLERDLGIVIVQRGRRFGLRGGRRVVAWRSGSSPSRDEMLADIRQMQGRLTVTARLGADSDGEFRPVRSSPPSSCTAIGRVGAHRALSSREIARHLADFEIKRRVDHSTAKRRGVQSGRAVPGAVRPDHVGGPSVVWPAE